MLFKLIAVLSVLLFAIVFRQFLFFVDIFGVYRTIRTHWPGPCRNVNPVTTGAEQIVVMKNGLAFISSGLVPETRGEVVDPRMRPLFEGKIYLFDFNNPEKDAKVVEIDKTFDFMPHGMSLLEDERTGEVRLFVVNHREHEDTVEIFTYDRKSSILHHISTTYDALFTSLNDVVANGPDSFYVTNDGYFSNSTLRTPERLLTLPWGSVVYYDGKTAHKVVENGFEPNGIAMSPDKYTVIVTMPFLQSINIYQRKEDNTLNLVHVLKVDAPFDNVYFHPKTGELWLGTLALPYMVAAAAGDMDTIAPAVACRLEPRGPKSDPFQSFQLYEVFADTTGLLSTSSSIVEYDDKILIGSIFHKLVFCQMETKH